MTDPAVSPDNKLVAAGYTESTQNILYIWDLETKAIRYELKGQPASINGVTFSPDGATLATAGNDGLIRLWNPVTGKIKRTIAAFRNDISSVSFSPDGRNLIVDVADQPTITYGLDTGKIAAATPAPIDSLTEKLLSKGYLLLGRYERMSLGPSGKIRFSPDGKTLTVGNGSLQVWDVASRTLKTALFGNEVLDIAEITYSSNGNHLAVVDRDGSVYAWDLRSSQREFFVSAAALLDSQALYASSDDDPSNGIGADILGVSGVAFSPDASQIALSNGLAIEIWDLQTGSKALSLAQTQPVTLPSKFSFSADGRFIYAAMNRSQTLAVWDAKSGALLRELNLPRIEPYTFTTDLHGPLFARNNHDDRDSWVEIWNIETGQMTKIPTHLRDVYPLHFSADGRFLAALLNYNQTYIWRTDTGQLVFVTENKNNHEIGDFAISPAGALLATTKYGKTTLWDLGKYANAAFQPSFKPLPMPPTSIPDFSSYEYETPTPQPTAAVTPLPLPTLQPGAISAQNASNLKLVGSLGKGLVNRLVWSKDGKTLLVTSSTGLYRLNPQGLQTTSSFEPAGLWVTSAQALADGRSLAAGFTPDGKIQVWDTANQIMLVELKGQGQPAISPNGRWLVYEEPYKGLVTWNLETNRPSTILHSNYQLLSWPVFSPNNQFVAAIQSNYSIRVWEVETGIIVNAVGGPEGRITDMSFSPDGNYLVGAAGGTAWVWSMAPSLSPFRVDLFAREESYNLPPFKDTVTTVATDANNALLAIGTSERKIWLYSRKTGQALGNLDGLTGVPLKLAFSPDSARLVSVDADGQMTLWDVSAQKPLIKAHNFSGEINGLVLRLDGNISVWTKNAVWTFDLQTSALKQITYIPTGQVLAASPVGDLVAGYTPLKVSLYDAQTGELRQTLPEEAEDVFVEYYWEGDILRQFYGALFSPDGKRLATFGAGGAWMYTSPDGKLVSHLEGNNTRKAAFSPDGEWLVTSHFEQFNSPALIDFRTAARIFELDVFTQNREGSRSIDYMQYAISPDKRWIGLLRRGWSDPSRLGLVDTTTGLVAKILDFEGATPLSLAFNPTETLIAVGQSDGKIVIVNLAEMKVIATFAAHKGPVNYLAFSADGRFLVSGSQDGTVRTWGLP